MYPAPELTGATWRKSTRSGSGSCVEVGRGPRAVGLRDTKDAGGPVLVIGLESWREFLADLRAGAFDRSG